MNLRLMIIGNTSETFHFGSNLARAAQEINIPLDTSDTSWNNYAPSMKHLWGRVFFKLAGKRPIEWWKFNCKTVELINKFMPPVVLVTGITPLTNEVFHICDKLGIKICNYLTDDPWNPWHYCSKFLDNLEKYDLVMSTKTRLLQDLTKHGVKRVEYLPFGYDPYLHYQPNEITEAEQEQFDADISFIGTGDPERLPYLNAVASLKGLKLRIYGSRWQRISVKKWQKHPIVLGNEIRLATYCSRLCLGLVRKRNRDESTTRTFEIAACGGCGIYEDTLEHRKILAGYPEYGFFSSPPDLAVKCKWLLEHPLEREQMRQHGIQIVLKETNKYTARLKTILEWCSV